DERSASGSLIYSDEAVKAALANGHPVFVDFTADWCITCKVNERVAIQAAATRALFDAQGVVVLVADWTNEDASITQALARFGRVGVPLYLLYRPGEQNPQILPQLLTTDVIREALMGDASSSS
ncbi:MAG: thioredoxin family protein, partial [Pseudomonadales bacterium]